MKLIELRNQLKQTFKENNIEVEDVDFIVSEVLDLKRTELVLIDCVDETEELKIREFAEMRLKNIPVEKIFKKAYFYGLEFKVDENVLSPRSETEMLVEHALTYIKQNDYKDVLDMCTGSGCVAVSIKKYADVNITAVDISSKALKIAKENAKTNQVEINFIKSDMFTELDGKFDLIVSNPPYIDTDQIEDLQPEVVNADPYIALDGGDMGMKYYNIIHDNLRKFLNDDGMILLEIGEDQKDLIVALFNDFEFVDCIKDYAGLDRILIFKK